MDFFFSSFYVRDQGASDPGDVADASHLHQSKEVSSQIARVMRSLPISDEEK